MIDTHAHLDMCAGSPQQVLDRAAGAGVDRVVTVGTGVESSRRALAVADLAAGVACVLGIHPHEAGNAGADDLREVRDLLGHPAAVAVGETGLDHHRDYAPRDRQLELFAAHVEIAVDLGKALVIHSRAADDETLSVLSGVPPSTPVILHCLSSLRLAEAALEHGYYVSFAGNVTYPSATELRSAAMLSRADRILAETDAPYLAPQPVRGRACEPAYVMHTLAALAEVRGEPVAQLERMIDENASRVFGLP